MKRRLGTLNVLLCFGGVKCKPPATVDCVTKTGIQRVYYAILFYVITLQYIRKFNLFTNPVTFLSS